jgi:hypothetical protein
MRLTRDRSLIAVCSITVLFSIPASAQTVAATVPGQGDIWLSGQPDGTTLVGDTAPAQSPLLVSLTLAAGSTITFTATGTTGGEGCAIPATGPDGCGVVGSSATNSLSGYSGPAALIGVFIGPGVPSGPSPATLPNNQSFSTLSPALNQVFFVGDGLTGSGSGTVQTFVVPAGATRLFLGTADGPGANFDNTGSYAVTVTQAAAAQTAAPVPLMPPPLLLVLAALLLALAAYSLRRRTT